MKMSIIKKLRECAPYHAHNILFNQPGLGSAGLLENFDSADMRSAKFDSADLRSAKLDSADLSSAKLGSADLKKRSREGLGLGGLLWKNFSKAANFGFAAWKSNAVAWKSNAVAWKSSAVAFASRFMMLAAISLSLTLAGCDTGGGGGGDSSGNALEIMARRLVQDTRDT